jgi:sec-independent protein translocase protein TatA
MHQLALLQNIGMPELVIIFVAVLLIFGPKALPQLGRSLGEGIREFRSATNKVTESLTRMDVERRGARARPAASLPEAPVAGSTAPVATLKADPPASAPRE